MGFDDEESDSSQEFSPESSTEESEDWMMGFFDDEESDSSEDLDSDEPEMSNAEAEEALETAENKINVLNQISDESFEELNDLLGSIPQENLVENEHKDEVYQENNLNS